MPCRAAQFPSLRFHRRRFRTRQEEKTVASLVTRRFVRHGRSLFHEMESRGKGDCPRHVETIHFCPGLQRSLESLLPNLLFKLVVTIVLILGKNFVYAILYISFFSSLQDRKRCTNSTFDSLCIFNSLYSTVPCKGMLKFS